MDIILIGFGGGRARAWLQILRDKEDCSAAITRLRGAHRRRGDAHRTARSISADGLDLDALLTGIESYPDAGGSEARLGRAAPRPREQRRCDGRSQPDQPAKPGSPRSICAARRSRAASTSSSPTRDRSPSPTTNCKGWRTRRASCCASRRPSWPARPRSGWGCRRWRAAKSSGCAAFSTARPITCSRRWTGGKSYDEALKQAQALGYAEADPTADVDGWDAAGKGIILAAALFGKKLTLDADERAAASARSRRRISRQRKPAGERYQADRRSLARKAARSRRRACRSVTRWRASAARPTPSPTSPICSAKSR